VGYTSLAMDKSGNPYVAYIDWANGQKATVLKYNGSSWNAVGSAAFSAGPCKWPSLALDTGGTPYLAFEDDSRNSITVMKYNGSSWVGVGAPGFTSGGVSFVNMIMDKSGTPCVSFSDRAAGGLSVYRYNGSSWVTLGSGGFALAGYLSMDIDRKGALYLSYQDAANLYRLSVMKYSIDSIAGISTVCAGDSTTLTDTTSGGTWSCSSKSIAIVGSSSGMVTGVSGGTATISYTANYISSIFTITINPSPNPGSIMGSSSVCVGSSITVTDAVGGGAWRLTNSSASIVGNIVTGISVGTDTIQYSVINSCGTSVAKKAIDISPLPFAGSITGSSNVCVGSNISLTDAAAGGAWRSTNGSAFLVGDVVTGVSAGTDTIQYRVTNSCGTAISSKSIVVNPLPDAGSITGPSNVCVGASIILTDAVMGGTWGNTNGSASLLGNVYSGFMVGSDTIKYTVTNTCGTDIKNKLITINALPDAGTITGSSNVCAGSSIALTDAAVGGIWSNANGSASLSAGIYTGLSLGTDTVRYIVTNSCGTDVATKVININPLPNAGAITGPSSVCLGSTITLTDAVTSGTWGNTNNFAALSGNVYTGLLEGVDTIQYTVGNNCGTDVAIKIITIKSLPNAGTIVGSSSVFIDSSVTLTNTVSGGTWSNMNTSILSLSANGKVKGILAGADTINYTVNIGGCLSAATFPIAISSFSGNTTVINNEVIKIVPNPNNGTFTYKLSSNFDEEVQIVITNIMGGKIMELTTKTNTEVDISLEVPLGVYFINSLTSHHSKQITKLAVR
jgi:hypothetical protein